MPRLAESGGAMLGRGAVEHAAAQSISSGKVAASFQPGDLGLTLSDRALAGVGALLRVGIPAGAEPPDEQRDERREQTDDAESEGHTVQSL